MRVRRAIGAGAVAGFLLAGVLPGVSAAGAAAPAAEPRMTLRVAPFLAPLAGARAGRDMPAYMAWTQNTTFEAEGPSLAPRDLVSNTVEVPRSAWGGEGSEEWSNALGVLAGSLSPYPMDDFADSFYMWTGVREGASVVPGEDVAHIMFWFTSFNTAEAPIEPSGRSGGLTWAHAPGWASAPRGRWKTYSRAVLPDGTVVPSPVALKFTRVMYLDHAQVFADGGDVDATGGETAAPAFEFRQPTPPGTVMNAILVGYSTAGPWKDGKVTIDFNTGHTSAATGEWRLPISVSVKKGGFIPERRDVPTSASPQFVLPLTALGIPAVPEEVGPGAGDVHLVADVRPGDPMRYVLALRRPDGSLRIRRLELDEPGRHVWRVEDGRLVEVDPAGPGLAATAEEVAAEAAEPEPPANTEALSVNEAGRPVMTDLVRDGVRLFDSLDVARLVTPQGPVELDAANRAGRAIVWRNAAGSFGFARAAYRAEGVFVLVRLIAHGPTFTVSVDTHSLDGGPHPHAVELVADLGDAPVTDRLAGEVRSATRFLPSELDERLVMSTGERVFPLGSYTSERTTVTVRDRGGFADGGPISDPVALLNQERPAVWEPGFGYVQWGVARVPDPPKAGAFTEVKTYRAVPPIGRRPVTVGPVAYEETRDLDGNEPFAIVFRARKPDGSAIRFADVSSLFLSLYTAAGDRLFSGNVRPDVNLDGGNAFGVSLVPLAELDPAEVVVYARATAGDALVTKEDSPQVPAPDWTFRIDRAPVRITSTDGGAVWGLTEPFSSVEVAVPELGVTAGVVADASGRFVATPDLTAAPGGDYEVAVRVVTPVPREPERTVLNLTTWTVGDAVPDDEVGTTTARLRYLPGGKDPSIHLPTVDPPAAISFLASRERDGAFDGALRPTAWAVRGLSEAGAPVPAATAGYLASLGSDGGYAWHPGEPATASATGLAATALTRLGASPSLDPVPFLRWDGGTEAASGADVSSVEGTALLVLGLEATGQLSGLDPWWTGKMSAFLEAAKPASPAEAYARVAGLAALGAAPPVEVAGDEVDAIAYRALLGSGGPDALAGYQVAGGGFTFQRTGDLPEALPTALALAALK